MKKFLVFFAFFVVLFTLTACTKNYTVTFETNGGTEITEVTVEKDGSLTLPANPSKTGYAFDGWFKDEALTTKWNAKTDKVTANITLYAKWNEIFTVTFNANGGSSVAALDIVDGGKATKPTDPTKPGFTFDGWYKEAALTNAWNFAQDVVTQDVTLYAKWNPVAVSSSVEFGEDPFNGTATTGVGGIGVALYYDASEDGEPVALEKVTFTVQSPANVEFPAEIAEIPSLGGYYVRAYEPGAYVITLTVEDADGNDVVCTETHTITYSAGDLADSAVMKAAVRAIYSNNIAANPDYRQSEGSINEWMIVGKNFVVFDRGGITPANYASMFVPFADFEGGEALSNFTVSFKYTSLFDNWKVLMSAWTGEVGNDGFAGDILRILTNRNEIGIQNDSQQGSDYADDGEAENIPLKEGPVYIKFTRVVEGTTATYKLYTSLDGATYELKITSVIEGASTGASGFAGKLTGFCLFSIDNDFIIEDLQVTGTVFTLE
jgi:uncharacterized repeat protein (TIGR02543 family)